MSNAIRGARPSAPFHSSVTDTLKADAFPGYACPNDLISTQWEYPCDPSTSTECAVLLIFDNLGLITDPLAPFGFAYSTRYNSGYHSIGKITDLPPDSWDGENPVFIFRVTFDEEPYSRFQDRSSEVLIVQNPPDVDDPIRQIFDVPAVCTSGQWDLTQFILHTNNSQFIETTKGFGRCVRVTRVCYRPNPDDSNVQRFDEVNITIITESSTQNHRVEIGSCIPMEFNLTADTQYRIQPVLPLVERFGGPCSDVGTTEGTAGVNPPYTQIQFTFGCDTSTDVCSE